MVRNSALAGLLLMFVACSSERPPDGRILIKNDSQDRQFNVIYVSGNGLSKSLKPGQFVVMPPGTTTFSVSRPYQTNTRSYSVRCPAVKGRGIYIKLIDIHLNRIAGGCVTTHASS